MRAFNTIHKGKKFHARTLQLADVAESFPGQLSLSTCWIACKSSNRWIQHWILVVASVMKSWTELKKSMFLFLREVALFNDMSKFDVGHFINIFYDGDFVRLLCSTLFLGHVVEPETQTSILSSFILLRSVCICWIWWGCKSFLIAKCHIRIIDIHIWMAIVELRSRKEFWSLHDWSCWCAATWYLQIHLNVHMHVYLKWLPGLNRLLVLKMFSDN